MHSSQLPLPCAAQVFSAISSSQGGWFRLDYKIGFRVLLSPFVFSTAVVVLLFWVLGVAESVERFDRLCVPVTGCCKDAGFRFRGVTVQN